MAGISEARSKVEDFFSKELKKDSQWIRVMEISKSEDGWTGTVEITEDNVYLKKMGYPPVFDKNIYTVKLDDNLNIVSYKQQVPGKEEEAKEESE